MIDYKYNIGNVVMFENEKHTIVKREVEFSPMICEERKIYTITKDEIKLFKVFEHELEELTPFEFFSNNLNNNNIIEMIEVLYKELDKLDGSREKSICLTKLDELKMWYERIK